jgi:hypothetical protein
MVILDPAQNRFAVEPGHHHVEQHEVERCRVKLIERKRAAVDRDHLATEVFQSAGEHIAVHVVVVDNENAPAQQRRRDGG